MATLERDTHTLITHVLKTIDFVKIETKNEKNQKMTKNNANHKMVGQ